MIKKIISTIIIFTVILFSCSLNSKKNDTVKEDKVEKLNYKPNKDDKVYSGDVNLTNQNEIDEFGKNNYTFIDGNLHIGNINSLDFSKEIFNVDALKTIKSINGEFVMTKINTIESISGLTNLERVNGDFTISGCGYKLKKIGDFNKLAELSGDITFANNNGEYGQNGITEISGFNNFKKINNIYITGNPGLKFLNCFNNIEEVKTIYISNTSVEEISNFKNLKMVNGKFSIEYSENLIQVSLPNLEIVKEHFALHEDSKINGNINLPKLKKINHLYLFSNKKFENYCNLAESIKQNKIDSLSAYFNKVDLTKEQVLEKCK